jgi:carbamoyltransferase
MSAKPVYVLGINAYDHDVSACLLRDGAIAYTVSKERITRQKHATGFYQKVVDYCLTAEGISLDDVDLIVRNCYVLPVGELETRMVSQDVPEIMDDKERRQAETNPLFLSKSDEVVTVSHHLAHAYSAFAVSPFAAGVVMVVDGVGNYSSDVAEPGQLAEGVNPLARESESYYRFAGSKLETLKKVWLQPVRGFLSDEFYYMPGLGALYSRVSSYIFADWNKCGEVMGLAPYGRPKELKPLLDFNNGELTVPEWGVEFNKPWLIEREPNWEASPGLQHWKDLAWRVQDDAERVLLDRAIWLRQTTGAKNLCMAGGVALNCVANGRIAREAGFENVWIQPAAGDDGIANRLCVLWPSGGAEAAARVRDGPRLPWSLLSGGRAARGRLETLDPVADNEHQQLEHLRRHGEVACRGACVRLVSGSLRIWTPCAGQPEHSRRSAQTRNERQAE